MGQLQTYDIQNSPEAYGFVLIEESDTSHQRPLRPGDWVSLRERGCGLVVAVNDKQMTVLWSQSPDIELDVSMQTINAKSRKLKAQWSSQVTEDLNAFEAMDRQVAEDLLYGRKTMAEVMQADSDIIDIMFTHRIEIKRRSRELLQRNTRDAIYDDDVYRQYDGARYRR